jgi:hypothetical protein
MLYVIPHLSAVAINDLHSLMQRALFGVFQGLLSNITIRLRVPTSAAC